MAVGDVYTTRDGNKKVDFASTRLFHIADFQPEQYHGWQKRKNGRRRYVVWAYRGGWKPERPPKPHR